MTDTDPPKYDSEFGRFDLSLGTVIGLRAFYVRGDGALCGIVHRDVWTTGVNLATCHHRPSTDCTCANFVGNPTWSALIANGVRGLHSPECTNETPCAPDEGVPTPGCKCGFYAYTEPGANEYGTRYRVSGIIEGWGRTIVGTRGFRTQKARILAIYLPIGLASARLTFTDEQRIGVFNLYPDVIIYRDYHMMLFDYSLNRPPFTYSVDDSSNTRG